jgi:hypothetical protein
MTTISTQICLSILPEKSGQKPYITFKKNEKTLMKKEGAYHLGSSTSRNGRLDKLIITRTQFLINSRTNHPGLSREMKERLHVGNSSMPCVS